MEKHSERERSQRFSSREKKQSSLNVEAIAENSTVLFGELEWLQQLIDRRLAQLRGLQNEPFFFTGIPLPDLTGKRSAYAALVNELELGGAERLLLICSLAPHIAPEIFTRRLRNEAKTYKVEHPEFGGFFDATFTNFVPTLQTVLFLLAGDDMHNTVYYHLSMRQSILAREQIITYRTAVSTEDETNERNHIVSLAPEYVRYLLSSEVPRLDFGRAFPASHVTTDMSWDDLVLNNQTRAHVQEVMHWLQSSEQLNAMSKIRPGFPCLFFGPPGTGKSLTAKLMGKTYGKDVFRIDLSMIVSKYVGETEKNLAYLFDRAENKDCILFFDEADSLFAKRTEVNSSNDKWSNLEMSYLLQRMEEYPGLTILATNLKNNIDSAMTRRFQAMIYFPRPNEEERVQLWKQLLPDLFHYAKNISFKRLSHYDLTGGNITNILKFCCTEALSRGAVEISGDDLSNGIRRELAKENRTI